MTLLGEVYLATAPDSIDFILSTLNHPVIFTLFIVGVIILLGSQGGAITPGVISGFAFMGYIMLELDITILNYTVYIMMFGVMLYIAMTGTSLILGDGSVSG